MEFKTKYNEKIFDKTKINHMARLKKNKWLLLDWDKMRFIVWDRKRNSYKVIKALGDVSNLISSEKLSQKHPFGMLEKDITHEMIDFPFTITKTTLGL